MTTVEAFAPAKINLALHVVGQREDGYHLLESLVVFANIGDHLTARLADKSALNVSGPMATGVPTGAQNLVLKAAQIAGVTAAFTLEKHLPAAAGIGGGSSDAAAALGALETLAGRRLAKSDLARLGADVPVCAFGRAAVMRGVGEDVSPAPRLPGLAAVLANPRVEVATPDVFKALHTKQNGPLPPYEAGIGFEPFIAYLAGETRNDLEPPALDLKPQIAAVLDRLTALKGARLARLSGSGATCFALFADMAEAEVAAAELRTKEPDWWVEAAWLA